MNQFIFITIFQRSLLIAKTTIVVGAEYLLEVLFGLQPTFSGRVTRIYQSSDKLGAVSFRSNEFRMHET